ncbi:MAG: translation initiation factor IF-2 [bacterium]|nr:translation initiation factor IF-2 [bacterium]
MRVHELAKILKISNKELLEKLISLDIKVASHISAIDDNTALKVINIYKEAKKQEKTISVKEEELPAKKIRRKIKEVKVGEEEIREEKRVVKEVEKEKAKKKKEELQEVAKEEKKEEVSKEYEVIDIPESLTIGELATYIKKSPGELIKVIMQNGRLCTINNFYDQDILDTLSINYNIEFKIITPEEEIIEAEEEEDESQLLPRPPIVTIMGHVDHGKTLLLDTIRTANVISTEAGGITQHIGAYKVKLDRGEVVFLDTPGHEAFTAMRARGASVTDIVVLVVAADDGVMPQTVEAINHANEAGVPIIIAVNKIDLPNVKMDKLKQQLSEYNLISEEWGGKTIFVEVSAKKNIGLDNLLEMLLLEAEMLELKANPNRRAKGTIIEAHLDKAKGQVATFLVQKGTLNIGDTFVVGQHYGKVRGMFNDIGAKVKSAPPSTPVEVLGLSGTPLAGDIFFVTENEKQARQMSLKRQEASKKKEITAKVVTLENLFDHIKEGEIKELNIIIKADVQGSAEAIRDSLLKLESKKVRLRVIHQCTGGINESDVILAQASNAIIIGFNVRPNINASKMALEQGIDIRTYKVIYDIIEDIKNALEGLLEPEYKENVIGMVEIRELFKTAKIGVIAGSYVKEGKITRNAHLRIVRGGIVAFEGKIASLRRFKEDVSEVSAGFECGIKIENFDDIKVSDILEIYVLERIAAEL